MIRYSEKGAWEILAEHLNLKMGMMLGRCISHSSYLPVIFSFIGTYIFWVPCCWWIFPPTRPWAGVRWVSCWGLGSVRRWVAGLCRNQKDPRSMARVLHHRRAAALSSLATYKRSTFIWWRECDPIVVMHECSIDCNTSYCFFTIYFSAWVPFKIVSGSIVTRPVWCCIN